MTQIIRTGLLAAAASCCLALPALADKQPDSGGYDATYAKREVQPIAENHILILSEATGKAESKGGLDGFSVSDRAFADLDKGSGPHRGYVVFSQGADRQIVRVVGAVKTVMKGGRPNVTMGGKYEVVGGAGMLAGGKGEGTYTGYFTAEDKYHIDWKGWYSPPEKSAKK